MDFKAKYIRMRDARQYDLSFFYDYYLSKGGFLKDYDEFVEHFLYTHKVMPTPQGYPPVKMRVGEIDREQVIDYMDSVFELTILKDKDNNFIKVVN